MAMLLSMMKKSSITRILFYLTEGVKADENKLAVRFNMESIESHAITENTYKPTVKEILINLVSTLSEEVGFKSKKSLGGVYLEGDIEEAISKQSSPQSTKEVNIYTKH